MKDNRKRDAFVAPFVRGCVSNRHSDDLRAQVSRGKD